jgi:nitrate reductase (NAD(P)H)
LELRNVMGMMNNGWYQVKPELHDHTKLSWCHPVDPIDNEGWMKPSTENQLNAAKNDSGVPDKQFTREEVEKHNSQNDCWIVVNNNVYDATSVLKWHPGGASSILAYAGKLTAEATSSFESVHDDYAHKKLSECVLGQLTDKAANYIKESAKKEAEQASKEGHSKEVYMRKQQWLPVTLRARKKISQDTYTYTFTLPNNSKGLGMGTCQHIQFGIHMKDKMLVRSYTPTRPILDSAEDGTFDLTIKTYYPTNKQPGGAFSNLLLEMPIGETVEVKGPTGEIVYLGDSRFNIEGAGKTFNRVSLILAGSGVTPGFQLLARVLRTKGDDTEIRVVDANKTEDDILLREQLHELEESHPNQIKITHVLSHPSDQWQGKKGHIDADIIREACFPPGENAAVFLCGPPTMIQKAALPALRDWGYVEEENMWGF